MPSNLGERLLQIGCHSANKTRGLEAIKSKTMSVFRAYNPSHTDLTSPVLKAASCNSKPLESGPSSLLAKRIAAAHSAQIGEKVVFRRQKRTIFDVNNSTYFTFYVAILYARASLY